MKRLLFDLKILFIPCDQNNFRPRFLQSHLLVHYVLVLFVLKIVLISFVAFLPQTVFFADVTENALFALVNEERESMGLDALEVSSRLDEAASQKARDMMDNGYFSHQSPEGLSPWYWFGEVGYDYRAAGENLAIGFLDSEEVFQAWLDSPSHRANLLSPYFKEMGIAVLTGQFQGKRTTVVVQHFGSPFLGTVQAAELSGPEPQLSELRPEEPAAEQERVVAGTEIAKFVTVDYPDLYEKVLWYSLALLIAALILDVFIEIKIQDKKLICKALVFIALLALFAFASKELLLQLIPHELII